MTALFSHAQIATVLAACIGYAAAHAAGLLTKAHAPAWVLGAVTVVLSTLAGVLPTVVWSPGDNWKVYVGNVFTALAGATLAHKSQIPSRLKAARHGVVG